MAAPKSGKTKKIELNEEQVRDLASMGCTMSEMAAFFKCHVDTIRDNYSTALESGREVGKLSARRVIWNHFKMGNSTAIKYIVHNILKEKIEEMGDKTKDLAHTEIMEKLASVSTAAILKLVKDDEGKVG